MAVWFVTRSHGKEPGSPASDARGIRDAPGSGEFDEEKEHLMGLFDTFVQDLKKALGDKVEDKDVLAAVHDAMSDIVDNHSIEIVDAIEAGSEVEDLRAQLDKAKETGGNAAVVQARVSELESKLRARDKEVAKYEREATKQREIADRFAKKAKEAEAEIEKAKGDVESVKKSHEDHVFNTKLFGDLGVKGPQAKALEALLPKYQDFNFGRKDDGTIDEEAYTKAIEAVKAHEDLSYLFADQTTAPPAPPGPRPPAPPQNTQGSFGGQNGNIPGIPQGKTLTDMAAGMYQKPK